MQNWNKNAKHKKTTMNTKNEIDIIAIPVGIFRYLVVSCSIFFLWCQGKVRTDKNTDSLIFI